MAGTTKKNGSKAKSASAKKTTGRSRKQTQTKNNDTSRELIRSEVIIIASFAAAVLLFLSNFQLCGIAGEFLRKVQLGIFGMAGFVAPVLLFAGTCFYLSNKGNPIAVLKLAAVVGTLIVFCGLAQMMFGGGYTEGQKLTDIFRASSLHGAGGGWLGGLLVVFLGPVFGTVGTYLVLLVLLIICVVCVTEKSVVSVVKKGGNRAYHYAKEDASRRRIIYEERKEERRRLREEQKIRGVDLNATSLTVPVYEEEFFEKQPEPVSERVQPEPAMAVSPEFQDSSEPELRPEDIFTGSIDLPPEYLDDDSVPFEEEIFMNSSEDVRETLYAEKEHMTLKEMGMEGKEAQAELQDEQEKVQDDPSEQAEGINYDEFFIPEEPKRVETATGKVIETDTEMLRKKLEAKRAEAVKEGVPAAVIAAEETKPAIKKEYKFPPLTLLKRGNRNAGSFSQDEYKATAIKLQQTLQNFGVGVTVTNISCGPSVTRYELLPEQGVKVSKIVGLTDDIKLSLAAADIRIEAPIPGKSAVGIEVPNKENNVVLLRDLLESEEFQNHKSRLAFAVGKDIGGQVVVTDVAKMPHLLIAGATGSGKSVCINTLIMSLIYKSDPNDVKMIMIDPKVVELSVYNGIPHLLIPVVTDPKKASGALNWAVAEMTDRYKKFAECNVRDLKGYNEKVRQIEDIEDEKKPGKLPQIVIIVDELADLMMVAPGEVEDSICRLAQLARAAGIHLIIATQRPSVNVITGLIKANVPSRIAFSVSSGVDSRTIIDMNGAEKLLGKGDMLFYPSGVQKPQRVQGAFVSDEEVSSVVEFLTAQEVETEYKPDIENRIAAPAFAEAGDSGNNRDEYFAQAGKFLIEKEKGSIGMLQRMFKIGFNRAARIMDQLAEAGVVGDEEGTKPRKILMTMEEFENMLEQGL